MIIFTNKNIKLLKEVKYLYVNEINLKNDNLIDDENINLMEFYEYYIVSISKNNKYYNYFFEQYIDIMDEVHSYYDKQQKLIKILSDKFDYYKQYLDKNIILKYFFLLVDNDFNLKNFTKNNFEINNYEILSNKKKIYIKYINQEDKFVSLINLYEDFSKKKYNFKVVKTNKPGLLNYIDLDLNFEVKRIFTLSNFEEINNNNNKRGLHYNINFDEIIIINNGKIELEIINKNNEKIYFNLKKNDIFFFPRNYWLTFEILDITTNITVLSNKTYNESLSCYDFEKFINQ
jgi:hypothetical protein